MRWTTLSSCNDPSDICRKTSTITGILIVDAAGMLAFGLTAETKPVVRSSMAIPMRPGTCCVAVLIRACRSASGPGIAADADAHAHANNARYEKQKLRSRRTLILPRPKTLAPSVRGPKRITPTFASPAVVLSLSARRVGDSIGGRGACAARKACEGNERGEVGKRLHQLAGNARAL